MAANFLTILSSIGSMFRRGVTTAIDIEQKALPAEIAAANVVTLVDPALGVSLKSLLAIVGGVEQVAVALGVTSGKGPEKLQAALPGVQNLLLTDPLFSGRVPSDLAAFDTASAKFTSAFVDLLNTFQTATAAKPAVPAAQVPVS